MECVVPVEIISSASKDRQRSSHKARYITAASAVLIATACITFLLSNAHYQASEHYDSDALTRLSMAGDIATLKDIHAAYVRGSVPTSAQESDDIMNQPFSDERNGADSASRLPNAYITGTVSTAEREAKDIVAFASSTAARDAQNKDTARTESLLQLPSKPVLTKLSMAGDIATLKDIHAAYVRGSVSTAAQESDDIMNQPFSDERDGADSSTRMPNAYITGTVSTADGEAKDIVSFASSTAVRDEQNKDVARTESLLQLPTKPVLTKLSMAGDIATLKDIHAAYVRGSVSTAAQESDDIMNQPFSDERDGADSSTRMPNAYITGTVSTADGEAKDIVSFASSTAVRDEQNKDVARTESLLQLPTKPVLTKLSMAGDIGTLKDIHAAYVRGSVSTAAQESDDIMNQPFSDERDGADSIGQMPNAYKTGTVVTAEAEAKDITSFASSTAKRDAQN